MPSKKIKLHNEKEIIDENTDMIIYCKCQICGDNAIGKGYNNRFFRCQAYPKLSKTNDEDDITLFSICDLCIERVREKDILVLDDVEYVVDEIIREEN